MSVGVIHKVPTQFPWTAIEKLLRKNENPDVNEYNNNTTRDFAFKQESCNCDGNDKQKRYVALEITKERVRVGNKTMV